MAVREKILTAILNLFVHYHNNRHGFADAHPCLVLRQLYSFGSDILNVVPSPGVLSTSIVPLCNRTTCCT